MNNKIHFSFEEIISTLFIIIIILAFCVFLLKSSKSKQFISFGSAIKFFIGIIICHLIIFPLIYTLMLKNNPKCFEFRAEIFNNEKLETQKVVTQNLNELSEEVKFVREVINSKDTILSKELKNFKKLYTSQKFYIFADDFINFSTPGQSKPTVKLYLFDLKGNLRSKSSCSKDNQNELESVKIIDIINEKNISLQDRLNGYNLKREDIEQDNFWTFAKILPYSISTIFTGNMNPVTPAANIFYTIHYFLVCTIGIAIFVHFIIKNLR